VNPYSRLSAAFLKDHPVAAARALEEFPAEQVAALLSTSSLSATRRVIEHFTPGYVASCLEALEPVKAGPIFSQLQPHAQILVLRQLDRNYRESLLGAIQPDLAASLRRLLPYPDGTAGTLVETPLASVPEELSVRDTLRRIKRLKNGMKFYIYAINSRGQLTGVLTLHELINAPPAKTIAQVMHRHMVSLSPLQSLQTAIHSPYWQEYHALPVTDENGILLGVIRQKGIRRYLERSAQVGATNSTVGILMIIGELFAVTAGHLLSALISTGRSLTERGPRG
jgi:magnesium transporter